MTRYLTAWGDVAADEAPGGLTKRRLDLPGATLVAVDVPAGTVGQRHSHPHDQFVQVVSGSGTLTTDQGSGPFAAGSVFVFPAGTWHSARFDTATLLIETNLAEG